MRIGRRTFRVQDLRAPVDGAPRSLVPTSKRVVPGGIDVAFTIICRGPCGKTFVSAIRPFPDDYICLICVEATGEAQLAREAWAKFAETHKRCPAGHIRTELTTYFAPSNPKKFKCKICEARRRSSTDYKEKVNNTRRKKRNDTPFMP